MFQCQVTFTEATTVCVVWFSHLLLHTVICRHESALLLAQLRATFDCSEEGRHRPPLLCEGVSEVLEHLKRRHITPTAEEGKKKHSMAWYVWVCLTWYFSAKPNFSAAVHDWDSSWRACCSQSVTSVARSTEETCDKQRLQWQLVCDCKHSLPSLTLIKVQGSFYCQHKRESGIVLAILS